MKTVLYSYPSRVGTFWIQPQPAGRVLLGIGGQRLRTYPSVKAAVEDVARGATGWAAWDGLVDERRPVSLRQWKKGTGAATPDSGERRRPTADGDRVGDLVEPDEG